MAGGAVDGFMFDNAHSVTNGVLVSNPIFYNCFEGMCREYQALLHIIPCIGDALDVGVRRYLVEQQEYRDVPLLYFAQSVYRLEQRSELPQIQGGRAAIIRT